MIYVATIHHFFARWIDVQLAYLERNMGAPYRVYACLSGEAVKPNAHRFSFAYSNPALVEHGDKLNFLAAKIAEDSEDGEDMLVFLDGDAFPIAPLAPALTNLLAERPLAAIRRDENLDSFPHPSFCATTVRFWRELGGDWSQGEWRRPGGALVADVGGRLAKTLDERRIEWTPVLRTNLTDLHPVLFGVYGNVIYHHGAGFRQSITRADYLMMAQKREAASTAAEERPRAGDVYQQLFQNEQLDEYVYGQIQSDEDFAARLFLTPSAS